MSGIVLASPVGMDVRPYGSPSKAGSFRVTQPFGPSKVALERPLKWPGGEGIPAGTYPHFHRGLDMGDLRCGARVTAAAPGVVTAAGRDASGAIRVTIAHAGEYVTGYWHLRDGSLGVRTGDRLAAGDLIGHVGSTGRSSACHLHLQLTLRGAILDPWPRLAQNVTEVDPMLVITDTSPKVITTRSGAVYYDPATGAKVSVAGSTQTRDSTYAVAGYRLVVVGNSAGVHRLLAVKPNDPKVTIADPPAPPADPVLAPGRYVVR